MPYFSCVYFRMSARLGGPGGSPALVVREARHEDYQAVMDINHNVYYGLDYLPAKYHNLLRDPNSNCYLLEVNGKVVCIRGGKLVCSKFLRGERSSRLPPP